MRTLLLIGNRVKSSFKQVFIRPNMSLILVTIILGFLAVALVALRFLAQDSLAHSIAPAKAKQQGCCASIPAEPRRMIGTFYTTEDGFQSTLVLNNKGPNQIVVTPILHSYNGQSFSASPVAVSSESSQEVDLNILASIAGPEFRYGGFEFTYEGRILEVGGGLRIVDFEKSLIFDEQMLEPGMKFPSSRLEAVYSIPFEDSQVSVIVTNTTAQPILVNGDAVFAGINGHHPIQGLLGPYETQVINLPHGLVKKASAGAVSLNHSGAKGALLAMIHLQDADRGYSEAVNFNNPAGGKTTERQGTGLRLGSVNNDPLRPVIAVRNLGDSATTVTVTVPYSKRNGDTGTIVLPQIALTPGEIGLLDTSNPQLKRNDFATAGLELEYTGAPGSVIASASSISHSGDHVFALPLKDPQGGLSSTGGYPWFIKESSSTVVFIKNTTGEPQQFHLDIIYPGGRWGSNLKTLAPGQTFELDVRKVRDSQMEGSEGNTIPLDSSVGHVYWSVYGTGEKRLIGRAQTVDLINGLSSTYECQCPCTSSYAESRLLPMSVVVGFPGDSTQFLAEERTQNCHGTIGSWYNVNPTTWWSDNSSIAAMSGSAATWVSPGSTTIRGSLSSTIVYWNGFGCAYQTITPTASSNSEVQDCTRPTGEITAGEMWDNIAPTKRHFRQILQPTNTSFNGRSVTEVDPTGGGPDTCHFPNSEVPQFIKVSGGTWPVGSSNIWGPDVIGWSPFAVSYYRMQGKAPCGTKFNQTMSINCPGSNLLMRPYVTHQIEATIGTTQVSASRAGQTHTRNYP